MPIINTNYGGNANFEKLLKAKNIIKTPAGTIDLFPYDMQGIVIGTRAFYWEAANAEAPIRSVRINKSNSFLPGSNGVYGTFTGQSSMKSLIFEEDWNDILPRNFAIECRGLLLFVGGDFTSIQTGALGNSQKMKAQIIPPKRVVPMTGQGLQVQRPIYVPDLDEQGNDLVSAYKSSTNWSGTNYATYIHGFSEAPVYNNATSYSCGDVCNYNNKFYAYYNLDDEEAGHLPTGTADNNDYWWYCGEVEVNA